MTNVPIEKGFVPHILTFLLFVNGLGYYGEGSRKGPGFRAQGF